MSREDRRIGRDEDAVARERDPAAVGRGRRRDRAPRQRQPRAPLDEDRAAVRARGRAVRERQVRQRRVAADAEDARRVAAVQNGARAARDGRGAVELELPLHGDDRGVGDAQVRRVARRESDEAAVGRDGRIGGRRRVRGRERRRRRLRRRGRGRRRRRRRRREGLLVAAPGHDAAAADDPELLRGQKSAGSGERVRAHGPGDLRRVGAALDGVPEADRRLDADPVHLREARVDGARRDGTAVFVFEREAADVPAVAPGVLQCDVEAVVGHGRRRRRQRRRRRRGRRIRSVQPARRGAAPGADGPRVVVAGVERLAEVPELAAEWRRAGRRGRGGRGEREQPRKGGHCRAPRGMGLDRRKLWQPVQGEHRRQRHRVRLAMGLSSSLVSALSAGAANTGPGEAHWFPEYGLEYGRRVAVAQVWGPAPP